jgi:hypothetical protein
MWQRLGSRKISWNFAVLGKVIRIRGMFMAFDPSGMTDGWLSSALTLVTSNPRLTSPSDVSSAGVICGRWPLNE